MKYHTNICERLAARINAENTRVALMAVVPAEDCDFAPFDASQAAVDAALAQSGKLTEAYTVTIGSQSGTFQAS